MIRPQLLLIHCLYGAGNVALRLLRRILWPIRPRGVPRRICVYRIGNVGDIVCSLPAMRAVRSAWPDARLVLLTSTGRRGLPGAPEILAGAGWVDEMIVYDPAELRPLGKALAFLLNLRQQRFDFWLELPSTRAGLSVLVRNMLFAKAAGAGWGGGWRLSTILLWRRLQSERRSFPNEVERLLRVVKEEGVAVPPLDWGFSRDREVQLYVNALLGSDRACARRRIAMAPGAKRSTNRWMPERWGEVGRALARQGWQLVLVGGAGEKDLCESIARAVDGNAVNLAGRTTIPVLAEVLRQCDVAICVDSGVQHIAAAVGVRCVSLMAARDFRGKWYPYGDHIVLERRVPCHTCLLEECPYDNLCMREISVDEVLQAVHRLAGDGAAARSVSIPTTRVPFPDESG